MSLSILVHIFQSINPPPGTLIHLSGEEWSEINTHKYRKLKNERVSVENAPESSKMSLNLGKKSKNESLD